MCIFVHRSQWLRGLRRGCAAISLAEIVGSYPAGGMYVFRVCCRVKVSATCRSLDQRCPIECNPSVISEPQRLEAPVHYGCQTMEKIYYCLRPVILYEMGDRGGTVVKVLCYSGTAVTQWLRCCATIRKVAGSIPAGVIGIFHCNKILPIALWPWG